MDKFCMRIVTWNLLFENKRKIEGIKHILSLNPDVICLQEVPSDTLRWLEQQTGHVIHACFDMKNKTRDSRNSYVTTITKLKPLSVKSYTYDHKPARSILGTLVYKTLLHNLEQHRVIAITLGIGKKTIQIANARLSCAVGTIDRLDEFQTMVEKTKKPTIPTVYCGDFNVVDSKLFNQITGWIRGFKTHDYQVNERIAFEHLYKQEGLTNIFKGVSTYMIQRPLFQLDHILVPSHLSVTHKQVLSKHFGSDHKICVADIDI